MIRLLLIALAVAAAPAAARAADPDRIAAAEALLARELAAMRVNLTCTALLPHHPALAEGWTETVTLALEILGELPGTEGLVATLSPLADPEALMPAPETPFARIRALCQGDPDWERRVNLFTWWGLGNRLERLLTE